MNENNIINNILDSLLFKIIKTQEIELSDLKNLLLICYNQLIADNPDKLTNSFLITVLKQVIDIEDYYITINNQKKSQWHDEKVEEYLTALIHPRVMELNSKNNGDK